MADESHMHGISREEAIAAYPQELPDCFETPVKKLSKRTRELMQSKGLAWSIMADYALRDLTSLEDVADRFDSPEKAGQSLDQTGFVVTPDVINERDVYTQRIKIKQVTRDAQTQNKTHPEVGNSSAPTPGEAPKSSKETVTVTDEDRVDLERKYQEVWGVACPGIRKQGALSLLAKLYAKAQKGMVTSLPSKYLIPYVPEDGEKGFEVPSSKAPGESEVEDQRASPKSMRQVERCWEFHLVSLKMVIAPFHNLQPFRDMTNEDFTNLHEWLTGSTIKGWRNATPGILMRFERKFWQEVEILMIDKKLPLKEAIAAVRASDFVTTELYLLNTEGSPKKGDRKGNRKGERSRSRGGGGKGNTYQEDTQYRSKPPKGGTKGDKSKAKTSKGDSKGKGKGKGKMPANYSTVDPNNHPVCRDMVLKGNCPRGMQCSFSHRCPVMNSKGWICGKDMNSGHSAATCPNHGK